jgi:hypothetical protein
MREIPLTHGQVALVDDDDYERVSQFKWGAAKMNHRWIAQATVGWYKQAQMHRFILGLEKGDPREVDHINRNSLDNRKSNLRIATRSQNMANRPKDRGEYSSKYKGVCKVRGRWIAYIRVMGKLTYLGTHEIEEEAARAYDRAALKHFGEFAVTNFPREEYVS